ncbi:unnamed protein product [Vitrella brassicaformis CCMP3155]|uniref:DNA/RNA non-specific endonuclease domain-containing protein n=2 Tax=Vitrella brassicaformis TaxID=1169539 RepID=A0A0G4G7F6_VITBC|nr:unnamed protein product [Vitrella brassicaformis CCMP3155]|eukprot:CEM24561.1 unnamed protein product [Vitrella brassicaformis CCMP3155]
MANPNKNCTNVQPFSSCPSPPLDSVAMGCRLLPVAAASTGCFSIALVSCEYVNRRKAQPRGPARCEEATSPVWTSSIATREKNGRPSLLKNDWAGVADVPCTDPVLSHYPSLVLPSNENLVSCHSYLASVNLKNRIPNWVAEKLTYASVNGPADRAKSSFRVDPRVPRFFTATNEDYRGSGYSRGHMAAAGAHKDTQEAMDQTFWLSGNILPQEMSNNGSDWLRLEHLSRHLTRYYEDVYCVSGPLFLPQPSIRPPKRFVRHEVVGEGHVAVPTHLFKIIMAVRPRDAVMEEESSSGNTARGQHQQGTDIPAVCFGVFVMPNGPLYDDRHPKDFQVPLSFVEYHSGLRFDGLLGHALSLLPRQTPTHYQPSSHFDPLFSPPPSSLVNAFLDPSLPSLSLPDSTTSDPPPHNDDALILRPPPAYRRPPPAPGTVRLSVSFPSWRREGEVVEMPAVLTQADRLVHTLAMCPPPSDGWKWTPLSPVRREREVGGELCRSEGSVRVAGWKYVGRLKLAESGEELDELMGEIREKGLREDDEWGLFEREYAYQKKRLVRQQEARQETATA